ncbi:acetamidase regulatory protein [Nannizzia gypsea CBS 118893]|uniref:Acetamidase regulatory protein n=1 Tax=Arthroderma gypseum (strain ATCC MYA-4604 / CBS 118893) TaxID=535722 RepID=E4UPS9_ARTGP|nr:acetamidase regulatory protein [Nannizzia gypsea CBS 118893]EFQ99901.1 acetamidase regulatory protein [Nannizzia gypsea CBS 118893]
MSILDIPAQHHQQHHQHQQQQQQQQHRYQHLEHDPDPDREQKEGSYPAASVMDYRDISPDEEETSERDKQLAKLIDEESTNRKIQKNVRVIYVGQDVSNLNFLLRQQHVDRDDEVYHFATNEISRKYIECGFEQVPRDAFVLPEPALADELVDAYFKHVNPGFPILAEDIFMAQYKGRDSSDAPSLLILQAVLLAGAHVSRPRPMRDTLKAAFFRRAKLLFEARVERNRDIMVQAALLLTWYSDPVDDDVAANAHYWVGVAARIATGLGMHRNSGSSIFVPHDKRMWRRAWWILVQFDVMVSLQYGRPQAINLDDCDVEPLRAADFEGCGNNIQKDYVIQFTELCCMISFIVRERFGLRIAPERRKSILSEADKALANWSIKLPDTVRMSTSDMHAWPALLHLTYNNFLILLHRPHPRASADTYAHNDAEICSAAAGVIVSIFEELREKDRVKYLWSSSVNTLSRAMIQIRVGTTLLKPGTCNQMPCADSTLPSVSLRALSEYWHNAESILHLFESSKRLKYDMQMVKSKQTNITQSQKEGDAVSKSIEGPTPQVETPLPQPQLHNWWPKAQLGERLTYFSNSESIASVSAPHHPPPPQPQAPQPHPQPQPQPQPQQQQQPRARASDHIPSPGQGPDWRQLFTFESEACGAVVPENLNDMEDEWRELYLHDPGLTDYFQESTWLQS